MGEDENFICNKLWDEVYIDYTGNVYSCCHEGPSILGNIVKEKLVDILNNDIIRKFRIMALNSNLPCLKTCNIHPNHRPLKGNETDIIDINKIYTLKILFGERCNINCIMCWQNSKNMDVLDFEELRKNIDLKNFKHIIIQGGEPFYCKEVLDFYDYVSSLGVYVSFLTNGLLINDEWAEKVALHSLFIHISLNAATKETHELINKGSDWETVLRNIQLIRRYKEKYNSPIEIKGHMTIVKQNISEIGLFIRNFQKLGFDIARFGYDEGIPKYLEENPLLKKQLINDISNSIDETNKGKIDMIRLKLLQLV